MTQNIFISGSMAYDDIMVFPHHFKDYFHPEKLHQINVSFVVSDMAKHLGGIATNVSYSLRLTSDYLSMTNEKMKKYSNKNTAIYPVGAVGRDGDLLLEFFKNNKIDTSYVLKDEKLYTATGKVITDMNDNQIWGFYYGAASINVQMNKYSNEEMKSNNQFWIISATHEKPFTATLRHVIKNKLPYLFDPGMTLTWIRDDLLKKGVMNATYVIGNDYEIAMIEKRLKMSVADLNKAGVSVITTLGSSGVRFDPAVIPDRGPEDPEKKDIRLDSDFHRNDKQIQMIVKAVRLRKVVDPTGAGDAWRGGFVGALMAGKSMRECLVMGNVMASFAVETMGTVEYEVNAKEIEKRAKSLAQLNHK